MKGTVVIKTIPDVPVACLWSYPIMGYFVSIPNTVMQGSGVEK